MPAPLDLTGCRVGQLTVVRRAGRVKFGRWQAAWECVCTCGATLVLPQARIHRPTGRHGVTACPACRRPPCAICGGAIVTGHLTRTTCSATCRDEQIRRTQLAHYYRTAAADPDYNVRRHATANERRAADPVRAVQYVLAQNARNAERRRRRQVDPDFRDALNARARRYYAEHATTIQQQRRDRLDAMPAAERAAWLANYRVYSARYAAKHRAEIRRNPTRHQAYLDLQREYRRQRELAKLAAAGARLIDRVDPE